MEKNEIKKIITDNLDSNRKKYNKKQRFNIYLFMGIIAMLIFIVVNIAVNLILVSLTETSIESISFILALLVIAMILGWFIVFIMNRFIYRNKDILTYEIAEKKDKKQFVPMTITEFEGLAKKKEDEILVLIRQFANNPNANFSVEIWINRECKYYCSVNDYSLKEDVQHPKFIERSEVDPDCL